MKDGVHKTSALFILNRAAYLISVFSFVFTAIYAYRISLSPTEDGGYRLIALQSALGALAVNLPVFLRKFCGLRIPRGLAFLYTLFLWGSIFLGEALGFYYLISHWDDLLHLVSGVLLGLIGFSVADMLRGKSTDNSPPLSHLLSAVFAVCFALSVGALWEIYEYICDGAFGINMQKFAEGSAVAENRLSPLVGRDALRDTMEDLIVDLVGAVTAGVFGYRLKRRHGRLPSYLSLEPARSSGARPASDKAPPHCRTKLSRKSSPEKDVRNFKSPESG